MRLRTAAFGISAIALAGGCVVWATWVRPQFVASRQVVNWANMQVYVGFLEDYRQARGRFPVTSVELAQNVGLSQAFGQDSETLDRGETG